MAFKRPAVRSRSAPHHYIKWRLDFRIAIFIGGRNENSFPRLHNENGEIKVGPLSEMKRLQAVWRLSNDRE